MSDFAMAMLALGVYLIATILFILAVKFAK